MDLDEIYNSRWVTCFCNYQKYRLYRNDGSLRGHQTNKWIFQDLPHESIQFFYGDSHSANARSISSTQMMSYIDSSKHLFLFLLFYIDPLVPKTFAMPVWTSLAVS